MITLRMNRGASWTIFCAVCFSKTDLLAESDLMRLILIEPTPQHTDISVHWMATKHMRSKPNEFLQ